MKGRECLIMGRPTCLYLDGLVLGRPMKPPGSALGAYLSRHVALLVCVTLEEPFSAHTPRKGRGWAMWIRGRYPLALPLNVSTVAKASSERPLHRAAVLERGFSRGLAIRWRVAHAQPREADAFEANFLESSTGSPAGHVLLDRRIPVDGASFLRTSRFYFRLDSATATRFENVGQWGHPILDERFELVPGASFAGTCSFQVVRFSPFNKLGSPDPRGWRLLTRLEQPAPQAGSGS